MKGRGKQGDTWTEMKRPTSMPTRLAMILGVSFSLAMYLLVELIKIRFLACARYIEVNVGDFQWAWPWAWPHALIKSEEELSSQARRSHRK